MTDTRFDVVALGNAIVDVIAPVDEAFITEWNIERDAMSLIDEPRAQALTGAAEGEQHSGGSAANTAAALPRSLMDRQRPARSFLSRQMAGAA